MDSTTIVIIILVVLIVAISIGFYYLLRQLQSFKRDESQDKSILLLQEQLTKLTQEFNSRMGEQNKMVQEQMQASNKTMQQQFAITSKSSQAISDAAQKELKAVTEKLTKLDDTNKRVESFAQQLQSLENILKNPKHRGVLGEYFLETILSNILPQKSYKMQYAFENGEIVDAAIFINKNYIVPIDAKFSLETFNKIQTEEDEDKRERLVKIFKQDLKERIDETSKYVRPEENTTTFAFMFIPAEGLYYNLLGLKVGTTASAKDIMQYAFSKNVIIVSPNSLFAYLQTVVEGLRRLEIQDSVEVIQKNVIKLQNHLNTYDEHVQKLGKHLGTTVNAYNNSYKEFKKIDKDVVKITGTESVIEPSLIDKPQDYD